MIYYLFFFFNDTATTEIYTLSLHDALPISERRGAAGPRQRRPAQRRRTRSGEGIRRVAQALRKETDRKSTRLNSSHGYISYAVFCLKKKKQKNTTESHTEPTKRLHPKTQSH